MHEYIATLYGNDQEMIQSQTLDYGAKALFDHLGY